MCTKLLLKTLHKCCEYLHTDGLIPKMDRIPQESPSSSTPPPFQSTTSIHAKEEVTKSLLGAAIQALGHVVKRRCSRRQILTPAVDQSNRRAGAGHGTAKRKHHRSVMHCAWKHTHTHPCTEGLGSVRYVRPERALDFLVVHLDRRNEAGRSGAEFCCMTGGERGAVVNMWVVCFGRRSAEKGRVGEREERVCILQVSISIGTA